MNSNDLNIAIVGATGAAGGTALGLLLERNHPANKIVPMASVRSRGRKLTYGDAELTVIEAVEEANLYDLNALVIKPATERRQCSLVEIMASEVPGSHPEIRRQQISPC